MSATTAFAPAQPFAGRPHAPGERTESAKASFYERLSRILVVLTVIGGLTFNFFLCFVNTRITTTWDSYVITCELILVAMAFVVAFDRRAGMYMFLAVFVTYMVLLFTLRGQVDSKAVRDIVVPLVFYFMGAKTRDLALADKLVATSVAIVVTFGMFEYLATDLYLDFFNVLGYYLARGSLNLTETFGHTRGLFISGLRPEPRTILPFLLEQHRVASVFLEPVSTGNFGVIAYSWALFRSGMRGRYFVMFGALTVIAMADARFGLYTCVLITAVSPVLRFIPRPVWLVLPFIMLALVATYGIATGTKGGDNSLGGRMAVTAHILTGLTTDVVFGAASTDKFTADSGLAYTLTKFGLLGFFALWGSLVFVPLKNARAWPYVSMVLIYLLLLMLISNSFYSIKTGALLWFILGTATHADIPAHISWFKRTLMPGKAAGSTNAPRRQSVFTAPAPGRTSHAWTGR